MCGKTIEGHAESVIAKFHSHPAQDGPRAREAKSVSIDQSKSTTTNNAVDDGETNSFGELWFPGANDSIAKYIRVSHHTSMDVMRELLFSNKYWNLKRPELIISVTGSATLNSLKHSLKETFCKGLVKVARNTSIIKNWSLFSLLSCIVNFISIFSEALITTGGTYNGCMKLVGEAFKENSLSVDSNQIADVLGIATWGSIQNNHLLSFNVCLKTTFNTFFVLIY